MYKANILVTPIDFPDSGFFWHQEENDQIITCSVRLCLTSKQMETLKTTPAASFLKGYTIIVVSKEAKDKATGQAETWHGMGTSLYLRRASMKEPE